MGQHDGTIILARIALLPPGTQLVSVERSQMEGIIGLMVAGTNRSSHELYGMPVTIRRDTYSLDESFEIRLQLRA